MVDVAGARVVAVVARAPSSGGKSRLFAELGVPPDRSLLEALLLDTIDGAATPDAQTVIAVTPASACDEVRTLCANVPVVAQEGGDLGERMHGVMAQLFRRGAAAVALIGSDLPEITASVVSAAFAAVSAHPRALVLGPATDGGYYLIAAARVPDVFVGVEWGSVRTLDQTLDRARTCGLRAHLLEALSDVDTAADLHRAARSGRAPRVAAWLHR